MKTKTIPHVTADAILDYIRTYSPGGLIHSDDMERDCLCYTIRACADRTLAAPWEPYDKKSSRHVWVTRGSLNVCRPGSAFVGPDLNLNLVCSLIAGDINDWLDDLAYWNSIGSR